MKNLLYALSEGIGICLVAGALIGGCNYVRTIGSIQNYEISEKPITSMEEGKKETALLNSYLDRVGRNNKLLENR